MSIESYFIRSGKLKKFIQAAVQLRSHAETKGDGEILSVAYAIQNLIAGGTFYVGIPDESYPTRYAGRDLNLEGMDDMVTIRVELAAGELGKNIALATQMAAKLRGRGDEMASAAELILSTLEGMRAEEYRGKTHQVASFDPLGERLGYI